MNLRQIIALCKASGETVEPATDCLPPERLAAYHDGDLPRAERAVAEAHLADCDCCLGQLAAIARAAVAYDPEARAPSSLLACAQALLTPPAAPTAARSRRLPVALAAAAALLLALPLVLDSPSGTRDAPQWTPTAQTRYVDHPQPRPVLLAPAESSLIQPLDQVFRWTEVPGALFYEVQLVSLDGDSLLHSRVDGTRWLIPGNLVLDPGEEYFVRVDAWLSDSTYLSSDYRIFRVEGAK